MRALATNMDTAAKAVVNGGESALCAALFKMRTATAAKVEGIPSNCVFGAVGSAEFNFVLKRASLSPVAKT